EGNSLRKAFLKAPLKFSRISSGFSGKRLHPVQKVMKAHLGTDYAAPYGTPILAVGDGVVEQAGRTGGNGNFVKIRHNGVYSTQYLHMQKILVKQGQRVQQGDVIGEVGSTGLATGPHVCFRFWKNGTQVDHRKEEFPSAEPIAAADRPAFNSLRDSLGTHLDEAELVLAQGRMANF
ncbi:MAG: M23 family metallopeptidase, partial [Flavobacteriales bacterium]